MPLTAYQRERTVALWTQPGRKVTIAQVKRDLALEGIMTTHETVKNTITRWLATGNVCDRPRSGPPKKVPEAHYRCIDDAMAQNDELTASALMEILKKIFGAENVPYGTRTVSRIRNELGWTFTTARYCQAIRDPNKEKRLDWCRKYISEKELFNDVIFTDESIFQLESHRRKCFRKKKTPRRLKYRHKHPPKIHVWGGISKQGATHLVMFGGTMNATKYGDTYPVCLPRAFREEEVPQWRPTISRQ